MYLFKLLLFLGFASLTNITHSQRLSQQKKLKGNKLSQTERIQRLQLLQKSFPSQAIRLDIKSYLELVHPPNRTFSVFVLFHDLQEKEEEACERCRWWEDIARSYRHQFSKDTTKCYFVVVKIDAQNYKKVKVEVKLRHQTFYYFAPTFKDPSVNLKLKMNLWDTVGNEDRPNNQYQLAGWVKEVSGVNIELNPKIRKDETVFSIRNESILCLGLLFCYLVWRFTDLVILIEQGWKMVGKIDYSKIIMGWVVWCISGQMFNFITGTGFAATDNEGKMYFVAGGFRDQLISESLIVMGLYWLVILGLIRVIEYRQEKKRRDPKEFDGIIKSGFMIYVSLFCLFQIMNMKY